MAIVMLVGCKKSPPRFEGPLRVEFGECAADPAWVSGPRPLPLPAVKTAANDKPKDKPKVDDPPPPEDPDGGGEQDPKLARQQAIEAARTAGIIGSTALEEGGAFASLTGTGDISSGFDDSNIYGGLLGSDDGGTGWGTIGTGRYGTIGHGSGTSSGMRGRRSSVPTVSIGQPNAQGDLDKAIIRRYIKRNIQKIQYCYEKELLAKSNLSGTVQTQFLINPDGTVKSATGNGVDTEVASCVASVIKAIQFPKPKGGGSVQVNYPFIFRPADGSAPPPSAGVSIGGSTTDGNDLTADEIDRVVKARAGVFRACYQKELASKPGIGGKLVVKFKIMGDGTVASASPGIGSTMTDEAVKECVARNVMRLKFPPKGGIANVTYPLIFTAGDAAATTTPPPPTTPPPVEDPPPPKPAPVQAATKTTPYIPGAHNPLTAASSAIEECLRTNSKPYGAVVVTSDPAGPKVIGVDEDVADCVATAAKAALVAPATTCSFSFGDIPIAELPGVDVSASAIAYGGTTITTVAAVTSDQSPTFKIDALFTRLDAATKAAVTSTAPIAIVGPLAIRPIDATPIAVVNKVVNTARAAGADPVLAREHGATWKLLHMISLPAIPVPRGTGGLWSSPQRRSNTKRLDDEHVVLSVLVQPDKIWVGLSRVNEFQPIPAGDLEKLSETIKQHKKSAFFVDRSDIEIGGELVTYGDVAKVIEVVRDAGFVDFYFADPAGLSARPSL